jgi:hypothetical protein
MSTETKRLPLSLIGAALAMVAILASLAVANAAVAKEIEGKVISKNSAEKTFRVNQGEGDGKVRIHTNSQTTYERLSGFGAIEIGMKVEAIVHRDNGHWLASKVERDR